MDVSWLRSHLTLRTLHVLLLGQFISFLFALASFTSSFIAKLGVDAPLSQMLFSYGGLAVIYGTVMFYRHRGLQVPWYWYLLLGFIDVQGNYLVNKAYQYTSITSVSMLQCWTIVWAIILTYVFIGTRYSLRQLLGASLSVVGLGIVMLSDAGVGGGDSPRPVLGDSLVVAGTVFMATSNVSEVHSLKRFFYLQNSLFLGFLIAVIPIRFILMQEFCVKKKDRIELLCMLGAFGFLVSIIEISIFERDAIASIKWSTDLVLALVGFVSSCVTVYSLTPVLLKMSGATMYNLSAITAGLWSVVVRIFIYDQQVDWQYYFAFAVIITGIFIYTTSEKDVMPPPTVGDGDTDQYQELNGENNTATLNSCRVTS